MSGDDDAPMQRTPEGAKRKELGIDKGEGGLEIPVPSKDDVMRALRGAARAERPEPSQDDSEND